MSRPTTWIAFIATLSIVLVIGVYAVLEPARQRNALTRLREEAISSATELYVQNCVVCHGAAGEGIGVMPALDNEGLRDLDYRTLFNTIARGRYGTTMAGWSVEEGGVLTNAQIDQLVILIQMGDWPSVEARVAELGLTPPTASAVEVSEETLGLVASLPDGETLSRGLTLYAESCVACHGANAEGTTLAPALDSPELRTQNTDEDLVRVIAQGVPGTLMAGWDSALTPQEISELVAVIRRWDEVKAAGIELPAVEVAVTPPTPEMIADGQQLFDVACTNCHGAYAQGTPMAPSLANRVFLDETPDQAIYQIIAQGVPGTMMPAWGGRLSDADLSALVAFLRSLESSAAPAAQPEAGAPPSGAGPPWLRNP
jgi:cbb3-type cytochrome c oxidase subunit III